MSRRTWTVPLASTAAVLAVVLATAVLSADGPASRPGSDPVPSVPMPSSVAPVATEPPTAAATAATDVPSALGPAPTEAVSSSQAESGVDGGVVPWTDTPGRPQVYAPVATTTMPPPCTRSDLVFRYEEVGPEGGGASVVVTNTSKATCAAIGAPEFAVVGAPEPLPIRYRSPYRFPQRPPGHLAPGESAHGDTWPVLCTGNDAGPLDSTVRLRISAADGGSFEADARGSDVQCGLYVDGFTKGDRLPPPAPISDVVLAIDSPDQVRAGAALLFTVELTNPTRAPIPLTPCPSYSMYVVTDGPSIERMFELNCAAAPESIPALGTVRFAMRLDIPAAFRSGPALKFVWQLETEQMPGRSGLPLEILPVAS